MLGKLAAGISALALGIAFVLKPAPLPEFYVQLRDTNLWGGKLFASFAHVFGFGFVVSLCALLAGLTIVCIAWRTHLRGSAAFAGVASLLAVLPFTGRLGVSLDPIGWLCAAVFCLLLESDAIVAMAGAGALVVLWSALQGGATFGALLSILYALGATADARGFNRTVRNRWVVAASCTLLALVQLHGSWLTGYGAHALYLDSLLRGAQRDRIFTAALTPGALGFLAIIMVAAWFGIKRRGASANTLAFFASMALALVDARNLPYFAIVAAPIAANAAAPLFDQQSVRFRFRLAYLTYAAAAIVFLVGTAKVGSKGDLKMPPTPLAAHDGLILCVQPRWCDDFTGYQRRVVLDDRAGTATPASRRVQYDVANATGTWKRDLKQSGINAVVSKKDDALVVLLSSAGWSKVPLSPWHTDLVMLLKCTIMHCNGSP